MGIIPVGSAHSELTAAPGGIHHAMKTIQTSLAKLAKKIGDQGSFFLQFSNGSVYLEAAEIG
jgi:hypothetical protein